MNNYEYEAALKKAASLISSDLFAGFLKEDTDRFSFLRSQLKAESVPFSVVEMTNGKHIVVRYKSGAYNTRFAMKTLVAHYDRAAGSEGANDNSVSCFLLMLFAKELLNYPHSHNIKIIFTDSEEAGAGGIEDQGSYKLALGLRKLNAADEDIFVFDMCGRGDVLVISQAGLFGRKNTGKLENLHKRTCAYAKEACPGKWVSVLTPYSDNAGFLAAGLTAQTITVLPRGEAELLIKHLPSKIAAASRIKTEKSSSALQTLTDLIIQNQKPEKDSPFFDIIPKTWQYMHTKEDTRSKLTPEALILTRTFLNFLASVNRPKN